MSPWVLAYQGMRTLKWLLWASFVGHSLYFMYDRAPHLTPFGHLTDATAFAMFGLSMGAVVAGFLELMLRDRAHPTKILSKR
jgi:surfactin synthase thioesterase subunit